VRGELATARAGKTSRYGSTSRASSQSPRRRAYRSRCSTDATSLRTDRDVGPGRLRPESADGVRFDRTAEALEPHLADRLGLHRVLGRRERPPGDQDLSRLRFARQARGEDDRIADRAVVITPLEADPAQRRIAGRDPDADLELVAASSPAPRDLGEARAH